MTCKIKLKKSNIHKITNCYKAVANILACLITSSLGLFLLFIHCCEISAPRGLIYILTGETKLIYSFPVHWINPSLIEIYQKYDICEAEKDQIRTRSIDRIKDEGISFKQRSLFCKKQCLTMIIFQEEIISFILGMCSVTS